MFFTTFAQANPNINKKPLGDFLAFGKPKMMDKILVIGAAGQLGSELTQALTSQYGGDQVIATDLRDSAKSQFDYCRFEVLDVMNREALRDLVKEEKVTQIYHLAAVLSATGKRIRFLLGISIWRAYFMSWNWPKNRNWTKSIGPPPSPYLGQIRQKSIPPILRQRTQHRLRHQQAGGRTLV